MVNTSLPYIITEIFFGTIEPSGLQREGGNCEGTGWGRRAEKRGCYLDLK